MRIMPFAFGRLRQNSGTGNLDKGPWTLMLLLKFNPLVLNFIMNRDDIHCIVIRIHRQYLLLIFCIFRWHSFNT